MTTAMASAIRAAVAAPPEHEPARTPRELFDELMAVGPEIRRDYYNGLDYGDQVELLQVSEQAAGTPYALWVDDPVGFVEDVLGENVWSKSRLILESIPRHVRTAVPSCFSSSKSWTVSRVVLWKSLVHPPSTVKVVTVAPKWSQVKTIIWPEIRKAHSRAGLPGKVDLTQFKIRDDELDYMVAWGLSASPYNESAVQGQHAPHLLLVVDEAGGLGHTIGNNLRALLTGDDSRMIAIGNPPTDDEGSWFEELCLNDDVSVIPISAFDTPNLTDEQTKPCRSCPDAVAAHPLSAHLIQRFQVAETIAEYGDDSRYVQAKVYARFPKGGPSKAIPADWIDMASDVEEPEGEGYTKLSDLVSGEHDHAVKMGSWVRLGVDVAADGGDELVMSRAIGDLVTVEHISSGSTNTNSVDVAGKVLEQIRRAELVRKALGTKAKVRVKIDGIGVGWGVASTLIAWGSEGLHDAEIVVVIVSEDTYRDDEAATLRPNRKRDEMWLTGRALMQPRTETGVGLLRLRVDRRCRAQLAGPSYGTNSGGRTVIESKKHMKSRGVTSPDRAEAVLLSVYEPVVKPKAKGEFRVIV